MVMEVEIKYEAIPSALRYSHLHITVPVTPALLVDYCSGCVYLLNGRRSVRYSFTLLLLFMVLTGSFITDDLHAGIL